MLRIVKQVKIEAYKKPYKKPMPKSNLSEQELLQNILQPLLVDFEYWFSRSSQLLEQETLTFLSSKAQATLLARVNQAQQEVKAAQMLYQATDGQVGIELSKMLTWHQLVSECWQISMQLRQSQQTKIGD
jgi:hypothetical protein